MYLIIAMGAFFCPLPLPRTEPAFWAAWFPRDQRLINLATVISFVLIILLTIVAIYFRGKIGLSRLALLTLLCVPISATGKPRNA